MLIIGVVGRYVWKTLGTKTRKKNTYLAEMMSLDEKKLYFSQFYWEIIEYVTRGLRCTGKVHVKMLEDPKNIWKESLKNSLMEPMITFRE